VLAVLTAFAFPEFPALFAGELPQPDASNESPKIKPKRRLKYRII
jgi:hypothetical protein